MDDPGKVQKLGRTTESQGNKRRRIRRRFSSRTSIWFIALVLLLGLLSSTAYYQGVPVAAQLAPNFVAPTISGSVDITKPGQESFWSQIAGTDVPLTSSNDVGGATKFVTMKMANNGTHILIYASWTDPTQSRIKNNVIEDENFPALFYANSSFFYEDRIVLWWSTDQNPGPPPCMQKSPVGHGEGESLAGTGNLWHWKAARTDSLGASYGKLKYGSGPNTGQPLIPQHSFADNEFINTTGHYQLGYDQYPTATSPGNFTIGNGENNLPYNTFLVSAHGVYDSSSHTWAWIAARSLSTTPTLHTVQFAPGQTHYFAVGVFDGGPIPIPSTVNHPAGWNFYGENEETKSISSWYTMALSSSGPSTTTTTSTAQSSQSTVTITQSSTTTQTIQSTVTSTQTQTQTNPLSGISFETALFTAVGTLIIGLVAGMISVVVTKFAARDK